MNTCHCDSHNNSLRSAIGSMRCDCGGALNQAQVNMRMARRLDELDAANFRLIGALQRLGADRCDHCGSWDRDCWALFDHCSCLKCLSDNPDWPMSDEGLNEQEITEMATSIVRYLSGKGRTPPRYSGLLHKAYKRITL